MRRFLITSDKFKGQAELIYGNNGLLQSINVGDTDMNAATIHRFKGAVAPHIDGLANSFTNGTMVVEAEFEATFDMFWKLYNKKLNKARCIPLWDKLNKSQQVAAVHGIGLYERYLKRESWRSKADPETYLRNKYWENEY
jgi:hypothetical protein